MAVVYQVSLTHAAKLRKVILGSLVLLVLVNPLVKVGLEEVNTLRVLEQPRPVLLLKLLLVKLHLNVLGSVVDLALGGVDLAPELELDVVLLLESGRGAGEVEAGGLEVEGEAILGHVGDRDGKVDEVLGWVGDGGSLGPEDCGGEGLVSASKHWHGGSRDAIKMKQS